MTVSVGYNGCGSLMAYCRCQLMLVLWSQVQLPVRLRECLMCRNSKMMPLSWMSKSRCWQKLAGERVLSVRGWLKS